MEPGVRDQWVWAGKLQSWPLFVARPGVITSFAVPSILGYTRRQPEDAVELVKYGATLDDKYYTNGQHDVAQTGESATFKQHLGSMVFADERKCEYLSDVLGCDVYEPGDCHTGIFSLEIVPGLGLGARLSGVTAGGSSVVYVEKNHNATHDMLESIIMSHMAVWRSQRGIVVLQRTGQVITFNFDQNKWDRILIKLREWATRHRIPDISRVAPHLRATLQSQSRRDEARQEERAELSAEQQAELDSGWRPVQLARAQKPKMVQLACAKKPVASRGGFAALMMDSDEGDDDDDDDSDEKSASEEESEEEVEPSRSSSRCPDVHVLSRLWRHMGQVSNVAWRFARTRLLTSGFRCAGGGRGRG